MLIGLQWVIYGALFAAGFAYNQLINYFDRRGWMRGYTSLFVVFGVILTVVPMGFVIGWANVGLLLIAFACSGFWMVVGEAYREKTRQDAEVTELRKLYDDEA